VAEYRVIIDEAIRDQAISRLMALGIAEETISLLSGLSGTPLYSTSTTNRYRSSGTQRYAYSSFEGAALVRN